MVQLFFIYADKCKHCAEMRSAIESAIKRSKIPCDLKEFLYTNKVAINIAINNGIDDLPGLVVGNKVFVGDNYTEEEILEAIKSYERN